MLLLVTMLVTINTTLHSLNAEPTYGSGHKHSKVLYHALSIEEVVGGDEEIPAECSEPWQLMCFVHYITYSDDLMETLDLDSKHLINKTQTVSINSLIGQTLTFSLSVSYTIKHSML